ncbi:MAG: NAD(P)H-hydrate dehydratase [Bacteroidales bacterium]|nr:NAD(P)H-hydrate dehydratase [Bacteroidales bacterium]
MKFFPTQIIRELDRYTINHEPISSIDLMERAALALVSDFTARFSIENPVIVIAGQGNNGGDALAMARLLLLQKYEVSVYLLTSENRLSPDCEINRNKIQTQFPSAFFNDFSSLIFNEKAVIIDGLFGSGLNRVLSGQVTDIIRRINRSENFVVSIDIPSGLMGEENIVNDKSAIVNANLTLALQFPKLAFLFPENEQFVGEWQVLDIGIHPEAIQQTPSDFHFLEQSDITPLLKKRSKFSHKGNFGHAIVLAGCSGMAGAAILSTKAALRSGAGLVTLHSASINQTVIQTAVPEVIFSADKAIGSITETPNLEPYNALAIGPGSGMHSQTAYALRLLFENYHQPCVLDADSLNIIAKYQELLPQIPKNSILTPHPKEFDRLFGACKNSTERLKKAQSNAKTFGLYIILKGAHTVITTPTGKLLFNSTGNPGMSTAGSGDVLTGILVGLLAQGYNSEESAKIGVFLHGRAADLALDHQSEESMIASDIIDQLGNAYKSMR